MLSYIQVRMCKSVWNIYVEESMYFILVVAHAFELIHWYNGEPSVFITVSLREISSHMCVVRSSELLSRFDFVLLRFYQVSQQMLF
jgi:hypothetical protein